MRRLLSRPGLVSAIAGLWILVELAAIRACFDATTAGVTFLGHALPWYCAVRTRLGIPCPTCGITRSVVLALHGRLADAWMLSPGGATALAGVAALAVALVLLGARQWRGGGADAARWVLRGALAWAGATGVVWTVGWVVAVASALA